MSAGMGSRWSGKIYGTNLANRSVRKASRQNLPDEVESALIEDSPYIDDAQITDYPLWVQSQYAEDLDSDWEDNWREYLESSNLEYHSEVGAMIADYADDICFEYIIKQITRNTKHA